MGRIEKTVFISYRRTNAPWALAISQNLTHHGYDVFFDYRSISSGDFESVILGNIEARAHFIVLLTPSALNRCDEPGDWLRREIEAALKLKRNIVPLMLKRFNFKTKSIAQKLTGPLAVLKSYNALSVPMEYFDEAMERLRREYLNVALDDVPHPATPVAQEAARMEQAAVEVAPAVTQETLTALEWFERGFNATNPDEKLHFYSEAIRLQPDYILASAFYNRGLVRYDKQDLEGAIKDYDEAIRIEPNFTLAFRSRGAARQGKGDLGGALDDYNEAIRLKPDYAGAFYNRGCAHHEKGDLDGAIRDYDEAIRLKPDYVEAFNNRGNTHHDQGDLEGALNDYNEAIRLRSDDAHAFYNRGCARHDKGDLEGAIKDYGEAIRLQPDDANAFFRRGVACYHKDDLEGALHDYNETSRLKPDYANTYYYRALIWSKRDNFAAAIADYQKYLDLGGGVRGGDTEEVKQMIRDLQKKLSAPAR